MRLEPPFVIPGVGNGGGRVLTTSMWWWLRLVPGVIVVPFLFV
jgi:hypothetical protein